MNEEKDKWERLINLADSYEPNPDLADDVIEKINQRESTVKFKKHVPWWTSIAACFLICCIALAIFLPVYFSGRSPEDIYFSDDYLEVIDINNINEFSQSNQLNIHYFSYDNVTTRCAKLIDEEKYAYLIQDMFYIGETGFDIINLKVVLLENATFGFYDDFSPLTLHITVSDISVDYSVIEESEGINYKVKFSYNSNTYYLDVTTSDSGVGVIEKYINLLLN